MSTLRHSARVGRKRRAAGWTLLTLGLLVAAVWVWSGWWRLSWLDGHSETSLERGGIIRGGIDSNVPAHWSLGDHHGNGRWEWWIPLEIYKPAANTGFWALGLYYRENSAAPSRPVKTAILLWPIPLLLWAAGVPVLRSGILARRRAVKGMCAKGGCGYSLAGLAPGAACPECGKRP